MKKYLHDKMLSKITIFLLLTTLLLTLHSSQATNEHLPQLCADFKCPPLSEIQCPEDSMLRETLTPLTVLQTANPTTTTIRTPEPTTPFDSLADVGDVGQLLLSHDNSSDSTWSNDEELFSLCCLAQKCTCRTCYIPDCQEGGEFVVELQPEAMDKPGQCCGEYECMREPNCTAEPDSLIWLRDCQRCQCRSGHRICHASCDEGSALRNTTAICNSKALNAFFKHGEKWQERCRKCECNMGEVKCTEPFCRSIDCPASQQVLIEGRCCPVCWPKDIPMPKSDDYYDYDDDDEVEQGELGSNEDAEEEDDGDYIDETATLPPLREVQNQTMLHHPSTTSAPVTAAAAASSTTPVALTTVAISTVTTTTTAAAAATARNATPCQPLPSTNANYQEAIYPEVIELIRPAAHTDLPYYIVIVVLAMVIIILLAAIIQLRARQRSYRPVSNFDDNFNKTTTTNNMKKMQEYA